MYNVHSPDEDAYYYCPNKECVCNQTDKTIEKQGNKMTPKLKLDGLSESEKQEVLDKWEDWITGQIADYMNAGLTDEITDDQAEALEAAVVLGILNPPKLD